VCVPNKLISLLEATGVAWEKFVHLLPLRFQPRHPFCYSYWWVGCHFYIACNRMNDAESRPCVPRLMQLQLLHVRLSRGMSRNKSSAKKRDDEMRRWWCARDVNSRHFHEATMIDQSVDSNCVFQVAALEFQVHGSILPSGFWCCVEARVVERGTPILLASRRAAFGTKAGHDRHRTCFPSHT